MNNIEKNIIEYIQNEFPLSSRPYKALGLKFGISEKNVFEIVSKLIKKNYIRRIGASVDSRKLGLSSTLAAMKVPDAKLGRVTKIVNALKGVTHNYLRKGEYNLWFTLTAGSDKEITEILRNVSIKSGIKDILNLPAEEIFKIKTYFKP